MYDPDYTRSFYDTYGALEWDRLEATAYGRLQAIIHADFIRSYVNSGDRVLDAGSGPGRFSIVAAELGATVTVLDLSGRQFQIARERIAEAGLSGQVEEFLQQDISDLSNFPEGAFDVVICFGGALSYVCERRAEVAEGLVRLVRAGGTLLVSVMSRFGAISNLVRRADLAVLKDPEGWHVWRVVQEGDLPGFHSTNVDMQHPAMHLYSGEDLTGLFEDCTVLALAGSNVSTFENSKKFAEVEADQEAWSTAVEIERTLKQVPGLVDTGYHLIMAAQRRTG
jgi:SAM-dependent methyltransferase